VQTITDAAPAVGLGVAGLVVGLLVLVVFLRFG
jgi:hypothetical protein